MTAGDESLRDVARRLVRARHPACALTGAGVSSASGIPTFREDGGVWDRYDLREYGTIDAFRRDPEKVWDLLREFDRHVGDAAPNAAHHGLARLERLGALTTIITQNGDGLHQDAGSTDVVELHGTSRTLSCPTGHSRVTRDEVAAQIRQDVPRCERCDEVLRPDGVFFGEALPRAALVRAREAARGCGHFLVVGTSAEVMPAAGLPQLARSGGAVVVEVNPDPVLDATLTVALPAEEALPRLAAGVAALT